MHYVYVLYDKTQDKMYTGLTNNLERRLKEHNRGEARTTVRMKERKLVYYEACTSKSDAHKREKQLKTGFGRGYLRRRLENSVASV